MTPVRLTLVRDPVPDGGAPLDARPGTGDVALVAALFALNLMPIAGELAGMGRWSPALVGFATGAAMLTGRELWAELRTVAGR